MNVDRSYTGAAGKISHHWRSSCFLKIDTEVTRLDVPEVCSSISQPELRRHRPCVEDGLVLAVIGRCALVNGSGCVEEEFRRVNVNFTFGNFEGQDKVSSKASAFQREEVELAKSFLIGHETKTSH